MSTLTLKNQKAESLIMGLLALALAGGLICWMINEEGRIYIPEAGLNRGTSLVFVCMLSLLCLGGALKFLIRYASLRGYDQFVIRLGDDSITYPESKSFRGYRPVTIPRELIQRASLHDFGKETFIVSLDDAEDHSLGKIPGALCPQHSLKPEELASSINAWLGGAIHPEVKERNLIAEHELYDTV